MQVFASRKDRRRALLSAMVVVMAFGLLYLAVQRYAPFLFRSAALRAWIAEFGVIAPLVFIVLQILQVIIAPIPGQVFALVAGYLFGGVAGTVYSLTGVIIGSAIAFCLARRYGRSFVEDILHDDVLVRFDGFVERVGIPGLFAIFLVPGIPDDVICFLSGLTTIRLRTFLVIVAVGRFPAYVITVFAGGDFASGQYGRALVLMGIAVFFSAVGYFYQKQIRRSVERIGARFIR
ncbi:TVP38/TMEM64 family protein [Halanaeroarchaeum sulfurireducens]